MVESEQTKKLTKALKNYFVEVLMIFKLKNFFCVLKNSSRNFKNNHKLNNPF